MTGYTYIQPFCNHTSTLSTICTSTLLTCVVQQDRIPRAPSLPSSSMLNVLQSHIRSSPNSIPTRRSALSAPVSPSAPHIPSVVRPCLSTSSFFSSTPQTCSHSEVASDIFISPPALNRNSCDSWNSSTYDFDDPSLDRKEDEIRSLGRTLDALTTHFTPFNGSISATKPS
ncbi:hypothetical protein F4604DRAFT_906267 [Suillus subluteus]|nr:hypothetical protein F4604DRAFT_906267 [Suillus subluteus]